MTGPNSAVYRARASVEDMLALLTSIDERRRCILEQAFHEGSWDAVFDEARCMGPEVRQVMEILRRCWCDVQAIIDERGE